MTTTKKKPRRHNHGLRKICACDRRRWAKCPHSWHFNYKPRGGKNVRISLDKHFKKPVATKADAEALAADLRQQIREGTFDQPAPESAMTLEHLCTAFLHALKIEHPAKAKNYTGPLGVICRTLVPTTTGTPTAFGTWAVSDIDRKAVLRFRHARHVRGKTAANRTTSALRRVLNWAKDDAGYLEGVPNFKKLVTTETSRNRRLQEGEEAGLLAACGSHLRAVVECALETGMRRGEILSLTWGQIEGLTTTTTADGVTTAWAPRSAIVLAASQTKTRRARRIPISSRLRLILDMRRCDPAGRPLPLEASVFGNALGEPVKRPCRAWYAAVLKSHGYEATLTRTCNLTAEARAAVTRIDLHFHDLRREAGSRWLEGGVPLHTVRDWLGHTNISQTSTYLAGTLKTSHDAMAAYEASRNRLARDVETGGRDTSLTTTSVDATPLETASGCETTVN